jgi:hypothetical protein
MVVDISNLPDPFNNSAKRSSFGISSAGAFAVRCGRKPPNFLRRLTRYFRLSTVGRGPKEGSLGNLLVADRDTEASTELAQLFFVQLFLLMRDIAAFSGFTQAVAFYGFWPG